MDREASAVDPVVTTVRHVYERIADVGEVVLRERPTMEHVLLVLFLLVGTYMYVTAEEFAPAAQTFPQLMAGTTVLFSALLLARNYLTTAGPIVVAVAGLYLVYRGWTTFPDDGYLLPAIVGSVIVPVAVVYREKVGSSVETFVAEPTQVLGETDMETVPSDAKEDDGSETQTEEDDGSETQTEEDDGSAAMYVYEIDDWRGPVVTGLLCTAYMILTYLIGMLYATPLFVLGWAAWARMDRLRTTALTIVSFVTAYLFYDIISDDIAEGWLTGWEPAPPDELLGLSIYAADVASWGVVIL